MKKKFLISCLGFMLTQAFLYWFLKLFQTDYHYINFFLDSKIPFVSAFIYIYNIFYPFTFLALYFLFCKDRNVYYKTIISGTIGFIICDLIFLIYPTIMMRPDVSSMGGLTGLIMNITYNFDTPAINCFPSVHCLFAFQVIISYLITKKVNIKWKSLVVVISFLIAISTLFVKQHYLFDMIAALIICIICNFITYKFKLLSIVKKYIKL